MELFALVPMMIIAVVVYRAMNKTAWHESYREVKIQRSRKEFVAMNIAALDSGSRSEYRADARKYL